MTLEDHRFEDAPGGRRSASIPGWSVAKIRRLGADGVKVLAYYHPHADAEVNEHQKAYVRAIGEACRAHDIPFILELIVYPLAGAGADYAEDPTKHPELVIDSVHTFAAPEFGRRSVQAREPDPGRRACRSPAGPRSRPFSTSSGGPPGGPG